MADVIMLYPKTGEDIGGSVTPPFSIIAASSFIHQEGYKVKIIDQRVDKNWKKTLSGEMKTSNPLFVGISCMTGSQIGFALEMADHARSISDAPLVFGGIHPTILPEQTLQDGRVDIITMGEGEETILELAHALEKKKPLSEIKGIGYKGESGKIALNPMREFLDVNKLPDTPWELIDVEDYITPSLYISDRKRMMDIGETSRGCPYRCAFCCSSAVKKHLWRSMTAEKAISMISSAVNRFKLDSIWIRDDNFYVDKKRAEEIFRGIIKEGLDIKWYTAGTRINAFNEMEPGFIELMKKSGCDAVKFGAESGCNRILEMVKKGQTREDILAANRKAKKFDITPSYAFMGGFPTEKTEELMMTVDLMVQIPKENPKAIVESLCMFTPHPGTELFEMALKYGLKPPEKFSDWASWSYYNEAQTVWLTEKEKSVLKNATDVCIYGGNLIKALKTEKNPLKRYMFLAIFSPLAKYYNYKWENKKFGYDPMLKGIRLARKLLIDKSMKV